MNRKKIFIIVGAVVSVGIISGVFFFNRERFFPKKETEKASEISVSPSPKEDMLLWDDPAGFTFQYPKGLTVDKHDEDQENYAHVELTSPDHKGRVIVWAKDTTATTISQWLKNEKSLVGAASIDTILGGNEAKKVMVKEPKSKQITATLDEDILVMVETESESQDFWQSVNDDIVRSMAFSTTVKDEDTGSAQAAGGEPQAEADEEETLE